MEFKTPTIEDKEEIDRCILADDTRRDVYKRQVFDIAPAYLSAKSGDELRASLL